MIMNGQTGRLPVIAAMVDASGKDVAKHVQAVAVGNAWTERKSVKHAVTKLMTPTVVLMNNLVIRQPMQVIRLQNGVPGPRVHRLVELENELGQGNVSVKELLANPAKEMRKNLKIARMRSVKKRLKETSQMRRL